MSDTTPKSLYEWFVVILISVYLLLIGVCLLLAGRIKSKGIRNRVRRWFHQPYCSELTDLRHDDRHCWVAMVPTELLSDKEAASCLVLFEDERQLGPAHSSHEGIRQEGGGRFSHWEGQVYFSTSDNSDPRINTRRYHVREMLN